MTAIAAPRTTRSRRSRGSSVKQVPGSAEYILTIATSGDVATGNLQFLLYDPATKAVQSARRRPHAVHRLRDDRDGQGQVGAAT